VENRPTKDADSEAMKCAICKTGHTRQDSHIIPKLVYRWLKKTSPTGYFRGTANPNVRRQDGEKIKLLCPKCEDAFSKLETEFANRIFHPVHTGGRTDHEFEYEEWFHRFAVSISWRTLYFLCKKGGMGGVLFGQEEHFVAALETWRSYLNGEQDDLGQHVQHLIVMDSIISSEGIENDFDTNLYIHRGVDFNTIHSPTETYIFAKLGLILICGVIVNDVALPNGGWARTEVVRAGGSYRKGDFAVSPCTFKFLQTGIDEMRAGREKISEKQIQAMNQTFFKRYGIRI